MMILRKMLRRQFSTYLPVMVLAVFIFCFFNIVQASMFEHGDRVYISNLHHIDEDLYVFSGNLIVDGQVDGDLFAFSEKVVINGELSGSITLAANKVIFSGQAGRSLRIFANTISIDGQVDRALMVMGNDIDIDRGVVIGQDLVAFGNTIRFSGSVSGKESTIKGDIINISGTFDGDVEIEGNKITIEPSAVILGNLTYKTTKEKDITIAPGASIEGETSWTKKETEEKHKESNPVTSTIVTTSKLLAAFIFGIILLTFLRRYGEESFRQLRSRFTVSLAVGILALLIFGFAVVVLFFSVVLVIIGFILSSGSSVAVGAISLIFSILMIPISSFVTVSGGIIFYSGKIIVGFILGYAIIRLFKPSPVMLGKFQLLIGLIVLFLLFAIPYLGIVIYLFVSIIGAGAIVLGIQHCRRSPETTPLQTNNKIS